MGLKEYLMCLAEAKINILLKGNIKEEAVKNKEDNIMNLVLAKETMNIIEKYNNNNYNPKTSFIFSNAAKDNINKILDKISEYYKFPICTLLKIVF